MLHHLSLPVADIERARRIYDPALGALGYLIAFTAEDAVGYGLEPGKDKLCLKRVPKPGNAGPGFHVAFAAPTRAAVAAFHRAAIDGGARDNGAPGLRPQYGDNYYAAFVIDADGHPIEAVCRNSEQGTTGSDGS
ncbi:MAG: VOC family protein [Pseudomonadota bacterium]